MPKLGADVQDVNKLLENPRSGRQNKMSTV